MPKLDRILPDGKGSEMGRKLGRCGKQSDKEKNEKIGKGNGKRYRADVCGDGKGERIRQGKQ